MMGLGYKKIEKEFLGHLDDLQSQLLDFYSEKMTNAFKDLEVTLNMIPPGNGYSYERYVKAKIIKVNFWLSNPEYERPVPVCKFEIMGQDQFGRQFCEPVSEKQISTKIPWQNFISSLTEISLICK